MEFPKYCKKFDKQSFFKITSPTSFVEIQLIGRRFFIHTVKADKYFEQLRVQEMIDLKSELYRASSPDEFEEMWRKAHDYLKKK